MGEAVTEEAEGRMRTYVMQVATGRELKTIGLIERVLGQMPRVRLYAPRFIYHKKFQGVWQEVEELLTPGYVYLEASSAAIDDIVRRLRAVPAMTKVLTQDGKIIPLSQDEVAWIVRLTGEDHMVEPSIGVIEGDRVSITSGPLRGMESQIKKIDRHKRLAYMEVKFLGRTKLIKVGVEIVRKNDPTLG